MKLVFASLSLPFVFLFSTGAHAMSIDWTGTYRVEWVQIDRPSLRTPPETKAYGLQYLSLNPHILAGDGIEISGKFDVLPSQDNSYNNSQMGQLFGQSVSGNTNPNPTANATDNSRRNVSNQNKGETNLRVSQLYMTFTQEYGSLLVGRAPFDFGMGLYYNSGNSPFDHWSTTMDLVAYKFIVGNVSFTPILGQASADSPAAANKTQDQMLEFMYDAKDSNAQLGGMIARRRSAFSNNDTPVGTSNATGTTSRSDVFGQTVTDVLSMQTSSIYFARAWDAFQFKMEADFITGDYGVQDASGNNVKNNSYGVGVEMEFPRPEGKWDYGVKLGTASGDDQSSTDTWEGFYFHRNYHVAQLLFNHRLGDSRRDFLRTNVIKDTTKASSDSLDDETISNAMYLSPHFRYMWSDRLDILNTITYAQLLVNPTNSVGFRKDLGIEYDIGLNYKPRTNVRWENSLGLLFPGSAFQDGNSGLTNGFTWGFTSRAAITF